MRRYEYVRVASSTFAFSRATLAGLSGNTCDWAPRRFKEMLLEFDSKRLLDKYDEFIKFLHTNPKAPRRRDDGRLLAETTARALADFRACVVAASKDNLSLVFRMLPPPG